MRSSPRTMAHISTLPRPELHLPGLVTIAFLLFLGVGAIGGGALLTLQPDGSTMGWDRSMLAGSPFADFLVPGLILGGLFGIGSFVTAIGGLRHARWAPFLAFAIGCAQMIWIAVELAIIPIPSFLQPTMFVVGLVIAVAALAWGWPTFSAWRHDRFAAGPRPTHPR